MKLAVIEVLDRDGSARLSLPVGDWPVTIGRSLECDLVLDDPHVAAQHATIAAEGAEVKLSVGETVNGIRLGRRIVAAQEQATLASGDVIHVGHTRVRVRLAEEALAPERPLRHDFGAGWKAVAALAVGLTLWNTGRAWINADPGARMVDVLPALVGVLILLAGWSGAWSVASRLVTHHFDFWSHARIALGYTLAATVLSAAMPLIAFASGWAFPSRISGLAAACIMCGMILAHLARVLPAHRRLTAAVVVTMFVAGVSLFLVRNYQVNDRVFPELYVSTIGPPALRMAPTIDTKQFLEEARALKGRLDARVADDADEGDEGF